MRSLPVALPCLFALHLAADALPAPGQVKLAAKPGGAMTFSHGQPVWRDEFASALKPGETWRFGANAATTWSTEAGLLFADLVVFPGTYNIGAAPQGDGTWRLVFHHDGTFYANTTGEGSAVLKAVEPPKKEQTRSLEVELLPEKKGGKGAYLFRATFGPKRMEGTFRTAKAHVEKGKAGKHAFTSTWLERTDVDQLAETLETAAVAVARLESAALESPLRLFLEGGDAPVLTLVAYEGNGRADGIHSLDGQAGAAEKGAAAFVHTVASGAEAAELTFVAGARSYHFTLPADLFAKAGD